ncbi:T9SS type A sorting domain-containing protein [Flavobacterium suncheonense]|uniref:T9SS type A sorting domain-containing protein n=1 Tax=Flavobacterium suncheonense TaxID=350894 RepID=UPI00040A9DAA|nr:T9SS type A sorting domain-containing protein [Flavobacterium suncheonense]
MSKTNFITILLACFFTSVIYGQQVNNTEFKTKTLQVFQNLDKNRVPHGILLDFGMEFTNLQAFNGTLTDSTVTTSQTLSDIYKTLLMCRVRSNVSTGFITPEEYATRWYTQREKGTITLSGQYFKYNRFADNAYPNKLNYSNNQFSDKFVSGIWQNPYEEKTLFAMAPSITKYKGLNVNVKIPTNLFLSNYPTTVQNLQIDFEDGLGYRLVTLDQLINVNYSQTNTYTWKYKITLTNGQTLLSHSKIQIEEGINATEWTQNQSVTNNLTNNLSDYYKTTITATVPYNGWYGSATVYIKTANGGTTITKPLIVAEGFDTGIILNPEQEAGDNNIEDFIININNSGSNLPLETNTYDIIYVDWNNGVDFIQRNAFVLEEVIKWVNQNKTGGQQNVVLGQSMGGLIARYALRDIELNRNFNHDTRLYVSHDAPHLGANTPLSVQYSARHLRNLYINTPIPFLSGEVVLPMIYNFAEDFSNIINLFGGNTSVDPFITPLQAFSLADVPAARQMQYTWVTNSYQINNTIHDAWQQELSQLGYPQGYAGQSIRNIAIANGSECGVPQVDNGNIMSYVKDAGRDTLLSNYIGLLDAVYGTVLTNPLIVVTALFPGKSYWEIDFQSKYMTTLSQSKNIYHGSIKYKKKIFWFIPVSITVTNMNVNQPAGYLPYDIYGGGQQKTNPNQLPLSGITSNSFGFIPTASALDIGKGTILLNDTDYRKSYVGALPPSAPKNTLFQNFVTHFDQFNHNNNNSRHISFNRRNGNWLRTELNTGLTPEIADCSSFCSNAQITGSAYLCTTGIYSVTNEATSVNWFITEGNSLVTYTTNGNELTLNQVDTNNSGYVTIAATYGNSKCGSTTVTKQVWIGKPNVQDNTIYGGYNTVSVNTTSTHSVSAVPGATQYYWFIYNSSTNCGCTTNSNGFITCPQGTILPKFSGSNSSSITTTTNTASINWGNCQGTYVVNCVAKNSCGENGISHKIINVYTPGGGGTNPCEDNLYVYPNPVENGEMNIIMRPPPGDPCGEIPGYEGKMNEDEKTESEIRIYDLFGNQVHFNKMKDKETKINVNIKRGHYVLNVFTSKGKIKREVIIVK